MLAEDTPFFSLKLAKEVTKFGILETLGLISGGMSFACTIAGVPSECLAGRLLYVSFSCRQ